MMQLDAMKQIFDKIKEYDRIVLLRHKRPDGDAVGSTLGLCEILRLTYPQKEILVINNDYSEYMRFLGKEDAKRPDEFYREALGIVLDTATVDRISNPQYALCRELVKIDHHIDIKPYGDYCWIEEERSSTCEMVAAFYYAFREELKINKAAATYIYTGMVTDSGRFRFRSVSGETLRLAGMLLDLGVEVDSLYSHLYIKKFEELKFQSYVYKKMRRTESGVAYMVVTRAMQRRFRLNGEQAGMAVSHMDSIKDSLIWLAFIEGDDKTIRVRLRSRFVTVNKIAEKYRGGGHDCACGATLYSKKEIKALLADADAHLKQYKESNEGWL